jgi:hypothetical protein
VEALEARRLAAPDQQISLTDPDARSMATSGRGSGVVGYNVQAAVDTEHHLIVAHDVVKPAHTPKIRKIGHHPSKIAEEVQTPASKNIAARFHTTKTQLGHWCG